MLHIDFSGWNRGTNNLILALFRTVLNLVSSNKCFNTGNAKKVVSQNGSAGMYKKEHLGIHVTVQ